MAKARDVPGIDGRERFSAAAARVVSVRATELAEHSHGVLDTTDIERVHDMRVATRRLRAVLEIFEPCFPRAPFKDALRDVKRIADALGERRDPDVHIDALARFAAAATPADRAGVESLVERLHAEQAAGNERLAAELARMERTDLLGRLRALAVAADPVAAAEAAE